MALPESNIQKVQQGVRLFIEGLGFDPDEEGFKDTPKRVGKLASDILDYNFSSPGKMTVFEQVEHDSGMISVVNVPFYSFCSHHLLPFFGHFGIAYIPDTKLLGLSKLVRAFRYPAKKPTTQEGLAKEAVDTLEKYAEGRGSIVWVKAEHMCMTLRGVKSPGCSTITVAQRGVFATDNTLRQQFIDECHAAAK
jgi:GTP cyclohydrolase I